MQTMKKEVENTNNYNNRVISSIILEKDGLLVVFYVKNDQNVQKIYILTYTYELEIVDSPSETWVVDIEVGGGSILFRNLKKKLINLIYFQIMNIMMLIKSMKIEQYLHAKQGGKTMLINYIYIYLIFMKAIQKWL